jgi:signal transduction histidine kinase
MKRMEELVDRSLTEVRLRVDPKVFLEPLNLLLIIDQVFITAENDAKNRSQILESEIDADLFLLGDRQLVYSALSNLVQNALKYTHPGGKIQIRASTVDDNVVIEVEDECGGLKDAAVDLFKAFEQQNENRAGLGLGLTIAQRAIKLNHGTIGVTNLPGKGCIFKIVLPATTENAVIPDNSKVKRPEVGTNRMHH